MSNLSNSFASSHEGFEVSVHQLKMTLKMHFMLFLVSALLFLTAFYFFVLSDLTLYHWHLAKSLALSWIASQLGPILAYTKFRVEIVRPGSGRLVETALADLQYYPQYMFALKSELFRFCTEHRFGFYASFAAWAAWPLMVYRYSKKARKQREDKFIRGAKLISEKELAKQTKKQGDLPFGKVKMPRENEVLHTLIVGAPGSGKTVLLSALLERMIERGEKIIIHDFKGDFTERFYNPERDLIFNPCDQRGIAWNIFEEINQTGLLAAGMDLDYIASVLFPANPGSEAIWHEAPRSVFKTILLRLIEQGKTTNANLVKALALSEEDLQELIDKSKLDQSALRHVMGGRFTQSILAILSANTGFFQLMSDKGDSFSIGDWLEQGSGCIFLLNNSLTKEAIRPALTLFLDMTSRKLLSFPDAAYSRPRSWLQKIMLQHPPVVKERRIFFLLDELGQLNRSASVKDLTTQGRSKGAAVFMGIQDIGQLDRIYGKEEKASIVNSSNNCAIFSLNEPETAKYFADKIGRQEVLETNDSKSMGAASVRDGVSISSGRRELYAVRPDGFLNLPRLQCYLQLKDHNTALLHLNFKDRPALQPSFVLNPGPEFRRSFLAMPALKSKDFTPTQKLEPEKIQDLDSPDYLS